MRTQLVAARTVAEALVDLALAPESELGSAAGEIPEIGGDVRGVAGESGHVTSNGGEKWEKYTCTSS
jgi:hypothetical protein